MSDRSVITGWPSKYTITRKHTQEREWHHFNLVRGNREHLQRVGIGAQGGQGDFFRYAMNHVLAEWVRYTGRGYSMVYTERCAAPIRKTAELVTQGCEIEMN